MAPNVGFNDKSAAELKKIPLPDRFLCGDCKKWKAPTQFSNKQLNDYRWKINRRERVTNISAKLRCRSCTGDQTQELHCTGPCTLWKGLEDFSKNQRKRPENAWCLTCTQWKEANEPGVTPAAAPNNMLSPDEEKEVVDTEAGFGAYSTDNIEGDPDTDDEDDVGFIYNTMATTSIADGNSAGPQGKSSDSKVTGTGIPSYLKGSKKSQNVVNANSSMSNPFLARSGPGGDENSQRSETLKTENSLLRNSENHEIQPPSGGMEKKPKAGLPYNAWDNLGQVHSQYRIPSQTTAPTGSAGFLSQPSSSSAPLGQAGGWAKQTQASRNPPPQFPALSRPVEQNIYDEDDDSQDEI